MGWSTPILKLSLRFDLSCAPVEFPDCMFHSCDAIVLTISVLWQTGTCQATQNCHCGSFVLFIAAPVELGVEGKSTHCKSGEFEPAHGFLKLL